MAVFKDLCVGVPVLVKKMIDDIGGRTGETDLGQKLRAARVLDGHDSGEIPVFCTRCGCTAVSAIKGLAKLCHGPSQRGHGKTVVGRTRSGEHPDKRRGGKLGEPWPIARKRASCGAGAAAWIKEDRHPRRPRAEIILEEEELEELEELASAGSSASSGSTPAPAHAPHAT